MINDYDKMNCRVKYRDDIHTYWLDDDKTNKCISVTTLISQFHEKFDESFWSKNKAFEAIANKEIFSMEKKLLLSTKKWDNNILSRYDIDPLVFNTKVNEILDEYSKNRTESCERGTKFHKEMEESFYKPGTITLDKYGIGGKFKCIKDNNKFDLDQGVYPEYLVYYESPDKFLKIAGQIDLLIKDGNDIWVLDWKSNKKIEQKSFFNAQLKQSKMMYYPINNLEDCNYSHYNLQLSTYAWMIEKNNPEFNIKGLILVHKDHDDNITTYNMNYLKDDVIRMLAYHKKQNKINYEKRKNTPIVF